MIVIDVFGDDDQNVLDERAKLKDEQEKIERMKRFYEEELRRAPSAAASDHRRFWTIFRFLMIEDRSTPVML